MPIIPLNPRPTMPPARALNGYYGPNVSGALSTESIAANLLRAVPFFNPRTRVYDRMGAYFTGGSIGGAQFRVGIYTDSAGAPGTLVVDFGSGVSAAGLTTKNFALTSAPVLSPGRFWLAIVTSGTLEMQAVDGVSDMVPADTSTGLVTGCWSAAHTFAALPSTFPTATTPAGVKAYRLMLRAQ